MIIKNSTPLGHTHHENGFKHFLPAYQFQKDHDALALLRNRHSFVFVLGNGVCFARGGGEASEKEAGDNRWTPFCTGFKVFKRRRARVECELGLIIFMVARTKAHVPRSPWLPGNPIL